MWMWLQAWRNCEDGIKDAPEAFVQLVHAAADSLHKLLKYQLTEVSDLRKCSALGREVRECSGPGPGERR